MVLLGRSSRPSGDKPITVKSGSSETEAMLNARLTPRSLSVERVRMEQAWIKNVAYFSGQHHFFFEEGFLWDIRNDPEYAHEVLYKSNLAALAIVRGAAKINGIDATFRVQPQTGSIRHRQIAEMSERVFKHLRDQTDFEKKKLLQTMWAAICGSGFLKVYWDASAGERERFYLSDRHTRGVIPEFLLSPEDKRQKELDALFDDLAPGEIAVDVRSPFTIYHDWSSRDASVLGCQWMAEKHFVDRSVVAERFGVDERDLQVDEDSVGLLNYEEVVASMTPGAGFGPLDYSTPREKKGNRCLYLELTERPSRAHRKGRRVVYAGGLLLVDGDNPNVASRSPYANLPYVKQDWVSHPGRFWGRSLMEDLTSPQHHVNDSTAKALEYLRVHGAPPTFVRKNCGIKTLTIRPGSFHEVDNPQFDVKIGSAPPMPPAAFEVRQTVERDLMMIASQSELDGSKLPSQLRSGEAIRLMQQERAIALNVPAMESVHAVRDTGRVMLSLAQLYYREERLMRYLGEDDEYVVESFSGADLHNDLVVIGRPDIGDTVAMARAELNDAVASGALNPQQSQEDRMLFLKAMRFGSSDEVLQTKLQAERSQEREIQAMIAAPEKYPQGYPVMEWEDHETEARVIVRFMYQPAFEELPPRTKALIVQHWKQHNALHQQQVMSMLQMQESLKGSPGQKGQASQAKAR